MTAQSKMPLTKPAAEKSGWSHDGLLDDLAGHLAGNPRRMVWRDMPMGPAGSQRPDVWTMFRSFTDFRPMAYEVKVSRADFMADATSAKWQGYLRYSSAVVFAMPAGLIDKRELPKGCGLMIRSDKGWRTVKGPVLQPVTIPQKVWLKLLLDGVDRLPKTIGPREASVWRLARDERRGLAKDLAALLHDTGQARDTLRWLKGRISEQSAELRQLEAETRKRQYDHKRELDQLKDRAAGRLANLLGLQSHEGFETLVEHVEGYFAARCEQLSADATVARLERVIRHLDGHLADELGRERNPTINRLEAARRMPKAGESEGESL